MHTEKSGNPLQRLVGTIGHPSMPAAFAPSPDPEADEPSHATGGVGASSDAHRTTDEGKGPAADLFTGSVKVPKTSAARRGGHGRTESVAGVAASSTGAELGDVRAETKDDDDSTPGGDGAALVSGDHPETHTALLESLTPAIERAQKFADGWPVAYRPEIFRVALGQLLGHVAPKHVAARAPAGVVGGSSVLAGHRAAAGALGPIEKLARALSVDVDALERTVHIDEDGQISILGRLAGKTRKELQTRYSLVYLYVKEMGLGNRMVDIEELRALCVEHGCYDQANFTGNYKKDVTVGLIREDGGKGSRARRYMLSQKGVAEGNALLRTMVEQ